MLNLFWWDPIFLIKKSFDQSLQSFNHLETNEITPTFHITTFKKLITVTRRATMWVFCRWSNLHIHSRGRPTQSYISHVNLLVRFSTELLLIICVLLTECWDRLGLYQNYAIIVRSFNCSVSFLSMLPEASKFYSRLFKFVVWARGWPRVFQSIFFNLLAKINCDTRNYDKNVVNVSEFFRHNVAYCYTCWSLLQHSLCFARYYLLKLSWYGSMFIVLQIVH